MYLKIAHWTIFAGLEVLHNTAFTNWNKKQSSSVCKKYAVPLNSLLSKRVLNSNRSSFLL